MFFDGTHALARPRSFGCNQRHLSLIGPGSFRSVLRARQARWAFVAISRSRSCGLDLRSQYRAIPSRSRCKPRDSIHSEAKAVESRQASRFVCPAAAPLFLGLILRACGFNPRRALRMTNLPARLRSAIRPRWARLKQRTSELAASSDLLWHRLTAACGIPTRGGAG